MHIQRLPSYTSIISFIRFCVVGSIGFTIDFLLLFVFVHFFRLNPLVGSFFSFIIATTTTFFFNKNWTFQNDSRKYTLLISKFFIVASVGLCFTILFMYLFWKKLHIYYLLAKTITAFLVLFWNFFVNKLWTFNRNILK